MHQKLRRMLFVCTCLLLAIALKPLMAEAQIGHRSTPVKGLAFDFERWPWPLHAEINDRLQELARMYPNIASTKIIGQSIEGRECSRLLYGTFVLDVLYRKTAFRIWQKS